MDGFRTLVEQAGAVVTYASADGIALSFFACVFFVSGISKLRHPRLAAVAMVNFGVARRARHSYGRALGLAEIALASLLAVRLEPRITLIAAGALLLFFTGLVARALFSGERFPCHCFGESNSTLNGVTLARTMALALAATVFAAAGDHSGVATAASELGVIEAAAAISVFGTLALAGRVPDLVAWNRFPFQPRARAAE